MLLSERALAHAIASLIEFLWFSFINFGTEAGQWCKIPDCPAIFGTVGNYAYLSKAPRSLNQKLTVLAQVKYGPLEC